MPAFREKDFITRVLKQLTGVFQQVLGLRQQRRYEEALVTLDGARQDLVSIPRAVLDSVDPATAAAMIGDAGRIRIWAKLLREEAEVLRDQGLDPTAVRTRAVAMMQEAMKRSNPTDDDRAFVADVTQLPG